MNTFMLLRNKDVSGVSGTGVVAQACEFDNGMVAVSFISGNVCSVSVYSSLADAKIIHGHNGDTEFIPCTVDTPKPPNYAVRIFCRYCNYVEKKEDDRCYPYQTYLDPQGFTVDKLENAAVFLTEDSATEHARKFIKPGSVLETSHGFEIYELSENDR